MEILMTFLAACLGARLAHSRWAARIVAAAKRAAFKL